MTCKQRGDIPLRDQNPLPRNFFLWGPRNYLSTLQSATVLLNSDCKYKMDCVKTPLISMPWLLRDSCCYRVSTLSSSPIFVFFLTQHSLTRCRCRRSAEIANNAHKQVTPPPLSSLSRWQRRGAPTLSSSVFLSAVVPYHRVPPPKS